LACCLAPGGHAAINHGQAHIAPYQPRNIRFCVRDLLKLTVARLSCFWADVKPSVQARWALIASASEVLLEADRVAKEIKKPPTTVSALIKAYTEDDEPWCLLDTHHRHMESRKYNFDFEGSGEHEGLEKLITKAEHRYTEVGSALAKYFVSTFQKAKHPRACSDSATFSKRR
jgi:hypothetical protein